MTEPFEQPTHHRLPWDVHERAAALVSRLALPFIAFAVLVGVVVWWLQARNARQILRRWEVERQLRDLENQIREENLSEKEWEWRRHYRERQAAIIV